MATQLTMLYQNQLQQSQNSLPFRLVNEDSPREPLLSLASFFENFRLSFSRPQATRNPGVEGSFWHPAFRGVYFCSRSEGACALLMQKYVPGFELIPGETFQIPLGVDRYRNQLSIDFRIGDYLFEYHPSRTHHKRPALPRRRQFTISDRELLNFDISKQDDDEPYRPVPHKLPTEEQRFTEKRLALINRNAEFNGLHLIVATSPRDFYRKVIKRFAPNPPGEENLIKEFNELLPRIRRKS